MGNKGENLHCLWSKVVAHAENTLDHDHLLTKLCMVFSRILLAGTLAPFSQISNHVISIE